MEIRETAIPGCYEIIPKVFRDERGSFVKTFHHDTFAEHGLATDWKEEFYSISRKGVLRGLHFQLPPHDHAKLVYCTDGEVFDAVVDLRKESPTFGCCTTKELKSSTGNMLYIPSGLAHGFYVLSSSATLVYKTSSIHAPSHDTGIRWNSAGIPWPDNTPIVSERDRNLAPFEVVASPF
ncbi:dTDP-4-dehydrorhamnose 3,5-epimerase [Geobacter sulfurreducens]|uniref:dTDP-4-dehydrorhamnose 3,5-epimerase n=1 Tax=Geobacter sulfurreducens TaxID=35554 RepID=UPI0020B7AFC5|nr:dTDP-4-dehydrorhamnose 3,5-epimerase [Geobacter sulfurreducens]UTG92333.1 dTDP-4-dehydrorhamnose 3,5-epimerase [Geobacter sulfurreducens]